MGLTFGPVLAKIIKKIGQESHVKKCNLSQ